MGATVRVSHDYVIVGAGAAGCVLAERLSADPAVSVLLVEDGGRGRSPLLVAPRAFAYALRSDRHVHRYATRPEPGLPAEWWTRGRGLGGSTAVNGLMYLRGAQADFDALAERVGDPGWDWEHVLAAYRAIEDHSLGGSDLRGAGGPLGVSVQASDDPVSAAVVAAAQQRGLRVVDDVNVSDDDRIGFTPATIAAGRRVSAATAFLRPALRRPNLTVVTGAHVDRVVVENAVATGVVLRRAGRVEQVSARREVVVSGGTIESPLLLERSGIGAADVLRAAGIEQVVDNPGVGEGMVEHRGVSMQVRFTGRVGVTERLNTRARRVREGARYLMSRSGPIASSGYDVVAQLRSSPDLARPDVQGVWVPMALDETASDLALAPYSGLLFTGYALRPTSTGSVHVAAPDASTPPVIEPHFLADRAEQAATVAALEHARAVVADFDLAGDVAGEVFPTAAVSDPDDVVAHARAHGGGIYHAVGSCSIGSVVDTDLRVHGIRRLRVVDASVLPGQVSGNTAAPVMALAWLAAERIRSNC
jgi:choline dehydrogenase-like flavoprotein